MKEWEKETFAEQVKQAILEQFEAFPTAVRMEITVTIEPNWMPYYCIKVTNKEINVYRENNEVTE